jgi:hypothetical protein
VSFGHPKAGLLLEKFIRERVVEFEAAFKRFTKEVERDQEVTVEQMVRMSVCGPSAMSGAMQATGEMCARALTARGADGAFVIQVQCKVSREYVRAELEELANRSRTEMYAQRLSELLEQARGNSIDFGDEGTGGEVRA